MGWDHTAIKWAKLESNSGLTPKLAVEKETGNKNMCITHALYHVDIIERCSMLGGCRKGEAHVRDRLRKTWWR